mmetsp:Transcript_43206/g.97653  ORF Transcript_43206/g.97653 Transcript_43206/m.97653 type:complete len:250 (-) Transcript_43206:82-831(-)
MGPGRAAVAPAAAPVVAALAARRRRRRRKRRVARVGGGQSAVSVREGRERFVADGPGVEHFTLLGVHDGKGERWAAPRVAGRALHHKPLRRLRGARRRRVHAAEFKGAVATPLHAVRRRLPGGLPGGGLAPSSAAAHRRDRRPPLRLARHLQCRGDRRLDRVCRRLRPRRQGQRGVRWVPGGAVRARDEEPRGLDARARHDGPTLGVPRGPEAGAVQTHASPDRRPEHLLLDLLAPRPPEVAEVQIQEA